MRDNSSLKFYDLNSNFRDILAFQKNVHSAPPTKKGIWICPIVRMRRTFSAERVNNC